MTQQQTRRVMKFLASTYWNNEAALKCQLAAMVLALRGKNVERAFWTQGPGGVGQSLNTDLIANSFGSNHSFVDMNIYTSRLTNFANKQRGSLRSAWSPVRKFPQRKNP